MFSGEVFWGSPVRVSDFASVQTARMVPQGKALEKPNWWKTSCLIFGAFCLDVRTLTFCLTGCEMGKPTWTSVLKGQLDVRFAKLVSGWPFAVFQKEPH